MSNPRPGTAGATRTCPHCKTTILASASICPSCRHYLRFDSDKAAQALPEPQSPLRVEGTIRHPSDGGSMEYSVVLTIRNDRGEELTRQVVGVGAMHANEERTFSLAVEMFATSDMKPGKRRH